MTTPTIDDIPTEVTLGAQLRALAQRTGRSLKQLSVFSENNDPYRLDTPANHRLGQWLCSQMVGLPTPIHFRGLHYVLVTKSPRKPNGDPYRNTPEDWFWLHDTVGRPARWLGYVPFADIIDERNAPPISREAAQVIRPRPILALADSPDLSPEFDLRPHITLTQPDSPQHYRLAMFGEKTSLNAVLSPLADEYNTDLYLAGGEQTTTHIAQLAAHASTDRRELVALVFADCDPAGYQMVVSIAHKLRAFKDTLYPNLKYRVYAPALTVEQVAELNLPSTPLKESERRADRWYAAFATEQTEIDALATLNPDALERIAREALDPFFDSTLAPRVGDALDQWETVAQAMLNSVVVDNPDYAALQAEAETALDNARAALDALDAATAGLIDMEALPAFQLPRPDHLASQPSAPIVSSAMSLARHIDMLQRRKNYED